MVKHSKRQNRKVKSLERVPSFFHFFESRTFDLDERAFAGEGGEGGGEGEAELDAAQVEASMEDLRMTLTFRDELVPSAAQWATIIEDGDEEEAERAR